MSKKRVLVFPCGSEIGLELYRSLQYSRHFHLIGASSIHDNGEVVFDNYIGDAPFVDDDNFESWLVRVVGEYDIDIIFPTMDQVISKVKRMETNVEAAIVGPSLSVCEVCSSKINTYQLLAGSSILPDWTDDIDKVKDFPIFAKPDDGYGSRGVMLLNSKEQLIAAKHTLKSKKYIFCEYLPGEEYTVDCFTDRHGHLLFAGPRVRARVLNGISSRTEPVPLSEEFSAAVAQINERMSLRGAWFCQFKRDDKGNLKLLEIAARFGGSSSLYRVKGVNFALLTLFDTQELDVSVQVNPFNLVQERSLDVKFKFDLVFDHVFVDYDDCIKLEDRINYKLVSLLYRFKDQGKKIILITRHKNNLEDELNKTMPMGFFDEIIHITDGKPKSSFINQGKSIFIDDSHVERVDVAEKLSLPVFSPDGLDLFNDI